MTTPFPEIVNTDTLFIWLIHRIAEEFNEHAILKGGMALRLLDSPRNTNDLDYVFIPYDSKKDIIEDLKKIVDEIPDAKIDIAFHSTSVRINIFHTTASVQIEANVSKECKSLPISTASLTQKLNMVSKIIRVIDFKVALANKMAAWNERRLIRDLYDIYFLYKMVGVLPDKKILQLRLANINSRLPTLKKKKDMSLNEFLDELTIEVNNLNLKKLDDELSPLMDKSTIIGLDIKIRAAVNELIDKIRS